jgi:hypothetical protein
MADSKAHYHESGAILVCMRGKGYTLSWPRNAGARPWESGSPEAVTHQDYIAGGMVSAAPGGGDWFHQHFATSQEPFRVLKFTGNSRRLRRARRGGEDVAGVGRDRAGRSGAAVSR